MDLLTRIQDEKKKGKKGREYMVLWVGWWENGRNKERGEREKEALGLGSVREVFSPLNQKVNSDTI